MLKTRINFLASLINNKNTVVDIGSDHAKLSKILIDEGKAKKVINIELNNGPLKNSIDSTKNSKYYNKIWNIKSNGIVEISLTFLIDTCVISGMGGKTIIDILNNTKKHTINSFVIQPNNNEHLIRLWCVKNLWKINNEYIIEENKIIYEILVISKKNGYIPIASKSIYFGKQNIINNSNLFKEKWNKELENLQNNQKFSNKYNKKIKQIKQVLKYEN